jgi:hypothetical protein
VGCNLKYGTAGATGGGFASQPGTLQPAFLGLLHPRWWCWQRRSPRTWRDPNHWYGAWSFGCRVGYGTPQGSDGASARDLNYPDLFEPFSCDGPGTSLNRFIRGQCLDESANPSANAIVQAFRTADDFYLGQDVSREDGTYICPTDSAPGTQHYLVAYKAGSPDIAGTTVNTITNTRVDGT